MAQFLTKLRIEKMNSEWRLVAPLRYHSDRLRRDLVVPFGFQTDMASVPRLPFTYALAGNTAHAAAVLHDYLYATGEVPRALADAVFAEAMAASGEPAWRRGLMWGAIRLFAGWAWARHRRGETVATKTAKEWQDWR